MSKKLELKSKFSRVGEYKINTQKSAIFLYSSNYQKEKLRKKFCLASKNKFRNKSRNKFKQGSESLVY